MYLKPSYFLLFITIVSFNAMAVEWEKIIEHSDATFYVDTDSFDNQQGKPSLKIKAQPKKNTAKKIEIKRYEFDCDKHLFKVSEDKKSLARNHQVPFSAVQQGSTEQQIESLTCQIHKMVGGTQQQI